MTKEDSKSASADLDVVQLQNKLRLLLSKLDLVIKNLGKSRGLQVATTDENELMEIRSELKNLIG